MYGAGAGAVLCCAVLCCYAVEYAGCNVQLTSGVQEERSYKRWCQRYIDQVKAIDDVSIISIIHILT